MDNNRKIQCDGVILDIDGTIWDSTEIVSKAWNRAARDGGSVRTEWISPDLLKTQFGKPMDVIADNIFPDDSKEKRVELLELCCRYEHEELDKDPCRVAFPGVIRTIEEMSAEVPFFIVSNCQTGYVELVCRKTSLTAFITDHECFGNTGKEKADNISLLVKRNGLKKPVYVGDTDGDRIACEEAGVPFIYVTYGFGKVKEGDCAAAINAFPDLDRVLRQEGFHFSV